jgi:hypothetical protein
MYFYVNILILYRLGSCFTYSDVSEARRILQTHNLQEYAIIFTYSVFLFKLYKEDILSTICKAGYIFILLIYS